MKLGGIKLTCSGIASDLSDFKAKTEAFLDKIESGSLMSGSIENESRSREALRFESARILSVLKVRKSQMEIVVSSILPKKQHKNLLVSALRVKNGSNQGNKCSLLC